MSKVIAKLFEPMFAAAAKRYQAAVGSELVKVGLRYDDLLDENMNLDVQVGRGGAVQAQTRLESTTRLKAHTVPKFDCEKDITSLST